MTGLIAAMLGVAVFGLAVRIYMGREAEDRLVPGEGAGIAELRSPLPQPSFLACPPGYCKAAEAIISPVFALPYDRLQKFWTEVLGGEPRIVSASADPAMRRFVYIQHSPTFRFPDVITVEFVPLGPDRSSLAIYSRSRYGEHDLGKNRKRVEKWLVLLERVAQPSAPRLGRAQ